MPRWNNIRLLSAYAKNVHDRAYVKMVSRASALDMLRRGEAVVINMSPLTIREARFLEYKDEAERSKGRIIPGVTHPDPDRRLPSDMKVRRCVDRHPVEGADQGRCVPPLYHPTVEERNYAAYHRNWLRVKSEEARQRAEQQMELANRNILRAKSKADRKALERLANRYGYVPTGWGIDRRQGGKPGAV